jgi:hypothetical protein
MRRSIGSLALVLFAFVVFPGTANASHLTGASANSPSNSDFVLGTPYGTFPVLTPFGTCPTTKHIYAVSTNTGANLQGFVTETIDCGLLLGKIILNGSLTCFVNDGSHTAQIGWVVTSSNSPIVAAGTRVLNQIVDNNSPSGPGTADRAGVFVLPPSPSPPCAVLPFNVFPTQPVTSGGYVVHNALP